MSRPIRPRIRPMTADDIDAATAALIRGDWGDRREWWRFAVDAPNCHPYVAEDGGEVVGTGVATIHGAAGWVGTIYTVPERRREGIGYGLSEVVCQRLIDAGCRTLVLAATPEGRPVYEKLGFVETSWYRVLGRDGIEASAVSAVSADAAGSAHAAGAAGANQPLVRSLDGDDLPDVLALDALVTGEDRSATLRACLGMSGSSVVRDRDGILRGFHLRAPWHGAAVIAPDPDDALGLLHARLREAGAGHAVRAGILEENLVGRQLLVADGWTELRRVVRMERGDRLDWQPTAIWGQMGFAVG